MKISNYRTDPKLGIIADAIPETDEDKKILLHWEKVEEILRALPKLAVENKKGKSMTTFLKKNKYGKIFWIFGVIFPCAIWTVCLFTEKTLPVYSQGILLIVFIIYGSFAWLSKDN
jgi:hypothetical protein